MNVRVRYAPSPTGLQHIGSMRTALFNYFFARASKGSFVLRIEDTDRKRFHDEALNDIYESFEWLGVRCDEGPEEGGDYGPYVQSERLDLYRRYVDELCASGAAYESKEERDGVTSSVVRLKIPKQGKVSFRDLLLGEISYDLRSLPQDPVLVKSDGHPTYHLANVIDDHLMQISHVLRSQEWVPSTPLHLLLYQSLGWEAPLFCHLPMVIDKGGQKLSKRFGALGVRSFRKEGYLPEAFINCVMLLGWAYDDKQQIFDRKIFEHKFSLDGLNKAASVFDKKKLDWLNGSHIRLLDEDKLAALLAPYIAEASYTLPEGGLTELIPILQPRLTTLGDVVPLLKPLCEEPDFSQAPRCRFPDLLEAILALLFGRWEDDEEALSSCIKKLAPRYDLSVGACFMELRQAITASKVSLPIIPLCKILGKDTVEKRITAYRNSYES